MAEYAVFANPEFDPNEYANAILAGEPYSTTHSRAATTTTTTGTKLAGNSATAEIPAKEDVSVAISKLNFGIDDVSKQIKNVVTTHHEELLSQAASAHELSGSLTSVRSGLTDLDQILDKLRLKIHAPYESLQANVSRLQKLQQASDVLRRTSRFVVLARRLEVQMAEMEAGGDIGDSSNSISDKASVTFGAETEDEKERTIAKAALSIAELVALLDGSSSNGSTSPTKTNGIDANPNANGISTRRPDNQMFDSNSNSESNTSLDSIASNANGDLRTIPLRSINAVAGHIEFIEDARAKVTSEMENMVLTGLTTLNQSLLASSLQTAYNLRVLPELVQSLVSDLSQAVEERIRSAFDLSKISKDALTRDTASSATSPQSPTMYYKSRVRTEPTNLTAPQWTAALWARLENLIEEMAGCCIKVYTLEKVLKVKKDTVSQVVFLDEAMKLLESKPSTTFWTSLSKSLEKYSRDSAKSSTFLQQALSTGYPRLLRLFHDFFAKIAVQTDTVYTQSYQSPETVLILHALSHFESLYLSRSTNKLNESVGQAFSGGVRSPPGMNEGTNIARAIVNELDSARFDPLLVRSVATNAVAPLEMMLSRVDSMITRDRSAVTLMGPSATPQQATNGSIASCLYHAWSRLEKLDQEYPDSVFAILKPSVQNIDRAYKRLVDPLLTAIRRELGAIIAKMHRIDFNQTVDPMSGMGGASFYIKDLAEKLGFIKTEILSKFSVAEAGREWIISIVKYVMRTFVLHVSIAKPLGESGKLQLTSDMTELEFALSAFMVENAQSKRGGNLESVGDEYRALRAMRPLLFLDNAQLALPKYTAGLPPLIVLHHILVRSPMPLPHSLHGWQEAEYVRWVDEHSEEEAWTLIEGGLSHWEKINESEGKEEEDGMEYVRLARTVLGNAERVAGGDTR